MKSKLAVCLFLAFLALSRGVGAKEYVYVERLVNAIGRAENSNRYPYGVRSINTGGDAKIARRICRNSVLSNLERWDGAGDFISFMAKRYAPANAENDPSGLNSHWVNNVKFYYERG